SPRAASTIGSRMHIRAGEFYSLHDLLYVLLLRSGNDAAVAIAEHISGSVEQFATLMNTKAKAIGATNSHFMNPHGLTQPDHYTTAHDLALIARYALLNETFADIVATREIPLTYEQLDKRVLLHNTNRLLHMLEGADGVKTGTTAAAGRCLVASATRDEQKLVAVILHAGNRWSDSQRLLEWGFGQFRLTYMGQKGERVRLLPVKDGKQLAVPLVLTADMPVVLPRSQSGLPVEVQGPDSVWAPVRKGQRLGKVIVRRNGQIVAEAELVAAQSVGKASLFDHMYRGMQPLLQWVTRGRMF
ncbi:MAG: D-alanyl-D-alanine carboxypeptidase family protein, partial [Mycobacterium leprae]